LYDPAINVMVMPHFKTEAKRLLIEEGVTLAPLHESSTNLDVNPVEGALCFIL
jgi:hypothetical protein